ncbi:hypothetical protein BU25DRAFT_421091 [Macroventuria anomochaeta]|uniref:Uncharacterized protein n=1 Tax=Macroventuria anomochaeta TaxID=301207 RepID=A0ACB6S4D7_9PLEO|nr:uncharacterized protein BU25DRAFT_421091 [Macroventuria anomochaeta]KAF2628074.1 hypothetical protein BU25DRAFT_421091 [Macroventuria anomochaeta]
MANLSIFDVWTACDDKLMAANRKALVALACCVRMECVVATMAFASIVMNVCPTEMRKRSAGIVPAGKGTCPLKVCCSRFGFCGTTSGFCEAQGQGSSLKTPSGICGSAPEHSTQSQGSSNANPPSEFKVLVRIVLAVA